MSVSVCDIYIYRITAAMKVETDTIISIAANQIEQAMILVIIFDKTLKPDVIVLLLTSQCV